MISKERIETAVGEFWQKTHGDDTAAGGFEAGVKWAINILAAPSCTLGMGCEEVGVCYALAQGEPEQCGSKL